MPFPLTQIRNAFDDKQTLVVVFSSVAIALYGYDQGMMSLINTNYDYLNTMGIDIDSPIVGLIVSVYYLGCAVGAVLFSKLADVKGRKKSIFLCLATASLGNLIMFISGMGKLGASTPGVALATMLLGRVIMGLGVGGIDSVIPTYSSELANDEARGKALAQEFQCNIFGLLMAYGLNVGVTVAWGKWNTWAWRTPIIVMQIFPILLMLSVQELPESPRWFIYQNRQKDAREALEDIFGNEGNAKYDDLLATHEKEKGQSVSYWDMVTPSHPQFHPTIVTIMGQINQALTGFGAVSVYGPQIFELLGFATRPSEYLTLANYSSYFLLMTPAWILIDALGRRVLLVRGSITLVACFLLLTVCGGIATHTSELGISYLAPGIPGTILLFLATNAFGICWLAPVWLIPTEIYPTTARAQGTAISVIIWGLANFSITFLTPVMFNNLTYLLFLVFAGTNAVAGLWTWLYLPESGGRSFEENQQFFKEASEEGTWRVRRVAGGEYAKMKYPDPEAEDGEGEVVDAERVPLLSRIGEQIPGLNTWYNQEEYHAQ